MKRFAKLMISLLLAAVMAASLFGCSDAPASDPVSEPDPAPTPSEQTTPGEEVPAEQTVIQVTEENTYSKPLPNLPEIPTGSPPTC